MIDIISSKSLMKKVLKFIFKMPIKQYHILREVNVKKLLFIMAVAGLVSACSNARFRAVEPMTCTVQDGMIECPDGTSTPVPQDGNNGIDGRDGVDGVDGRDGIDGVDGIDGRDGTLLTVVDPCGDGPGHDEILIQLNDGTFLAWYVDLGLTVLEESTKYRTTDAQRCKFQIIGGEVFEL